MGGEIWRGGCANEHGPVIYIGVVVVDNNISNIIKVCRLVSSCLVDVDVVVVVEPHRLLFFSLTCCPRMWVLFQFSRVRPILSLL